jgi:hypothetical protein
MAPNPLRRITSMTPTYNNKFVLRQEFEHPGSRTMIVFARREDLGALGRELVEAANAEKVSIRKHATIQRGRNSRVYLTFESASTEEIGAWHVTSLTCRIAAIVRPVFFCTLLVLALIGIRSLFH